MNRKSIVAVGHSHLGALLNSAQDRPVDLGATPLEPHFLQIWGSGYEPMTDWQGGRTVYHAKLEADLLDLVRRVEPVAVITSLIGSEATIWAIEGNARPFDVILPDAPGLPRIAGAEIIPYSLFRGFVQAAIGSVLGFNRRIRELTGLPVFQVLPPPPVANDERLRDFSPEPLKSTVARTGTPSPVIRHKIWRVWIDVAEEIAARDGIGTIAVPEDAIGPDGLVAEAYSADCVHGNTPYGALAWRNIDRRLAEEVR